MENGVLNTETTIRKAKLCRKRINAMKLCTSVYRKLTISKINVQYYVKTVFRSTENSRRSAKMKIIALP